MADKNFGVKELNLIGASGTPTIDSPNNLNINAVNVAISTSLTVGQTISASGINVSGISTFNNDVNVSGTIYSQGLVTGDSESILLGNSNDLAILHDGSNNYIDGQGSGSIFIRGNPTVTISRFWGPTFDQMGVFNGGGSVDLYYNGAKKFETTGAGVTVTGILTATSLQSNGTTGDGSDRGFTTKYYITANGSTAYRFAGPGSLNTDDNPTLYFHRGFTYILENSTGSSHPFALRVSAGGADYAPGGNFLTGSQNGTQILTVPFDAPSSIVYQCTIHTANMVGTINFVS